MLAEIADEAKLHLATDEIPDAFAAFEAIFVTGFRHGLQRHTVCSLENDGAAARGCVRIALRLDDEIPAVMTGKRAPILPV